MANAVGTSLPISSQLHFTSGSPMCGRPLGTAPSTCTCCPRSSAQLSDNGADHGDQRAGYFLRDLLRTDNDCQHAQRDGQGVDIDLLDLLNIIPDLLQGAVPPTLQAQHAGDLAQRDLDTDAGQETDQHRARQKVRHESQTDDPRQYEEARGHEGKHGRQRHVLVGPGRRQAHQPGGENGGCRRIGSDHQVP